MCSGSITAGNQGFTRMSVSCLQVNLREGGKKCQDIAERQTIWSSCLLYIVDVGIKPRAATGYVFRGMRMLLLGFSFVLVSCPPSTSSFSSLLQFLLTLVVFFGNVHPSAFNHHLNRPIFVFHQSGFYYLLVPIMDITIKRQSPILSTSLVPTAHPDYIRGCT